MPQLGPATVLDRADVLSRFAVNRRRTRALFDLLDESMYYQRPISLRNPVVFYEGHVPAFAVNTLIKKALGWRGIDEHLETIFARGIDPESEADVSGPWQSGVAVADRGAAVRAKRPTA